jgi:hypothetical protein
VRDGAGPQGSDVAVLGQFRPLLDAFGRQPPLDACRICVRLLADTVPLRAVAVRSYNQQVQLKPSIAVEMQREAQGAIGE